MKWPLPLCRLGPCFLLLGIAVKYEAEYQRATMGLVPRMGRGFVPPSAPARVNTNVESQLKSIRVRSNSMRLDKLIGKAIQEERVITMDARKCPPSMIPVCKYSGGHWIRCKWHAWLAK